MAYTSYLYFPGSNPEVVGETSDQTMSKNKAMEALSFSFGLSNASTLGSGTGGGGAGKATFSECSIMKATDKATATLVARCADGTHLPDAVLELQKSGNKAGEAASTFAKFSFKEIVISSMHWGGGQGQDQLFDNFTFDYGAFKIEYFAQDKEGKIKKFNDSMWSRIKNNATFAVA